MTTIDCSTINNETLAHLVIINHMVATTGCTHEQAKQLLISTEWRLEAAINLLFDERSMPIPCCKFSEKLITPANTPATPPNFPETLLLFNKLSSSSTSTSTSTTTTNVSNDNTISSSTTTTNPSLSSSPMNLTMMMMDGTA